MARIESAYFGDEKSFQNITSSLVKKIADGVLDVTADEKLIPVFEAAPTTKLDNKDEKEIRDQAVAACGGEADNKCLDATMARLRQDRLKEKERESVSKNVIKGRRLTVNVIDKDGKRKQLVAPDGQKFRLENVSGAEDPNASILALPTASEIQKRVWIILGVIAAAFTWVFSIVAVYAVFMRQYEATGKDSFRMIAYGATAASILIPYSGYFIILFYFGGLSFFAEYTAKG
jgi:hypothetical protein